MSDQGEWSRLVSLGVSLRPIDRWPGPETVNRRWSPFRASVGMTLKLLSRELEMLNAKNAVLQCDFRERDIRMDGLPRADARMLSPRVQLAFDSKYGPLQYATDEFIHWDDNLRGIALAMEALRKVDRYGVSKRGEQYQGWRALPYKTYEPADDIIEPAQARAFLEEHGGSFKEAARRFHPDKGGDASSPMMFRAATKARDVLKEAGLEA